MEELEEPPDHAVDWGRFLLGVLVAIVLIAMAANSYGGGFIMYWVICGAAGYLIAVYRGASNAVTWLLWGVFLGPFGMLLAAIFAKRDKPQVRH